VIAYASRTGTRRNLDALRTAGWRLMVSATGAWRNEGFAYALDNGAWTAHQRGEAFDSERFEQCLDAMGAGADWIALPDIVAGGMRSLAMSLDWMPRVQQINPRVLIPVQDGMTPLDVAPHLGNRVGIFVGGSTEFKIDTMFQWGSLARLSSCYLHVGRVNTRRRILQCAAAGADSFDGTSASQFASTIPLLDWSRRQSVLALGDTDAHDNRKVV